MNIERVYETMRMQIKKYIVMIATILLLFTTACSTPAPQETASLEQAVQDVTEETAETTLESTAGSATEPEQPASEPTPPEPPTLTLIMVGDVLLHTPVAQSGQQADGSYDFDALFAQTKEAIQEADLALVNQEVILGGEELGVSGYPAFNAPHELGDALMSAGFDVVLHGTNHALDKGKTGLLNCLDFWSEKYPQTEVLGIHDSAEDAEELYIYEQDGMKIAILNYTYSTNGIEAPQDMPYAVDMLDETKVQADLIKAESMADFTIVCPHWGTEYNLGISSQQEKWTKIFLRNGVDLVLGTHPHVIEPVEWVTDEQGNSMLVYYSLGNFVNWTASSGEGIANRMVGGMANVTLQLNEQGEVEIAEYGVSPLVAHLEEGTDGVTTYFLEDYTTELAQQNKIIAQDPAFSYEYCRELCQDVWGSPEGIPQ